MSDMTLLRIGIAVAMTLLLGAIIFFGRGRKNERGQRIPRDGERVEPAAGFADRPEGEPVRQEELALDGDPAPVELGKRDAQQVEVLSGLKAGDQVVVEQSYLVKADIEKSGASHDH